MSGTTLFMIAAFTWALFSRTGATIVTFLAALFFIGYLLFWGGLFAWVIIDHHLL